MLWSLLWHQCELKGGMGALVEVPAGGDDTADSEGGSEPSGAGGGGHDGPAGETGADAPSHAPLAQ